MTSWSPWRGYRKHSEAANLKGVFLHADIYISFYV